VCALFLVVGVAWATHGFQVEQYGVVSLAAVSPATTASPDASFSKRLATGCVSVLKRVAVIVIGVYVGLSLYMFAFQERVVFYPSRRVTMTPDQIGLPYEELKLETPGGDLVSAWFVPCETARGVAVFCHGNAGNIGDRLDTVEMLNEFGLSTLVFDYPGYGTSDGRPSERGAYDAAKAAWDFVVDRRGCSPEDVVVFGRSLGGPVAAWLAQTVKPAGLVLESTFISASEMGVDVYPYLPVRLLCRIKFPTRDYLAGVSCPVLVVHSEDDELIRFRHGEALYAAAPEPKEFCRIVGAHNDGFLVSGEMYKRGVACFLDRFLPVPEVRREVAIEATGTGETSIKSETQTGGEQAGAGAASSGDGKRSTGGAHEQ